MGWLKVKIDALKDIKVKRQLMAIYFIVVLVPIIIIGVNLTRHMCDMVVDRAINEASINIDRIKERLDEIIKMATTVSNQIYLDDSIIEVLTTRYESYGQVVQGYSKVTALDTYLKYYDEIGSIRIYTDNDTILNNSQFMHTTPEVRKSQWYQEAIGRNGKIEWMYKTDEITGESHLSLVRAIRNSKYGLLGVLVININPDELQRFVKDEPYDTLIAVNKEVVCARGASGLIEGHLVTLRDLSKTSNENYKLKIHNEEGVNYIIFKMYSPSKTHDTTIEICVNMSVKSITSETLGIIRNSAFIVGVCMILSFILISIFSKSFAGRIILVKKEMHKVVSGNFNIKESIEGHDEIAELYRDIYQMVQSIQQLVNEVYVTQVQKEELKRRQKEMEFDMLARQINPHFLYNTLETIRMKAYCNGQVELANVVKMLSKLMRRNLEVTDREVTLQSELDLIKAYLDIQRFRFGERIKYEINCEIDPNNYNMLPLILQPIVENAFVHGLEGKSGQGMIVCQIKERADKVAVTVCDDGLGITPDRLEQLHMNLKEGKDTLQGSFGLSNINQRLKLYYGECFGVYIESQLGEGTTVNVCLPKA